MNSSREYTAFDLSILDAEGGADTKADGLYSVSVELDFNPVELVPEGADIDGVEYQLFHIHGDSVEELEATVDGRTRLPS